MFGLKTSGIFIFWDRRRQPVQCSHALIRLTLELKKASYLEKELEGSASGWFMLLGESSEPAQKHIYRKEGKRRSGLEY